MNNITTYVTLIDTNTTYSRLRTTDIDVLYNSLPPADQQNKVFLVGQEMEILDRDSQKYLKWKVESMEFRVMDGEILPPDIRQEMIGNANAFNTELRIYITRLEP